MNDLTVLREYRAGEPGPTPAETVASQDHLMAAAIEAEPARHRPRPGRPRPDRRRLLWVPVTAAAATEDLTHDRAIGCGWPGGPRRREGPGGGHGAGQAPPPATVDAAFVLHQAARSAASQD